VKLNVSKSGLSTTIGGRGLSVNVGKRGTYLNAGLPGTGLSMRERLDKPAPRSTSASASIRPPSKQPLNDNPSQVAGLTSSSMPFWRSWFTPGYRRGRQSFLAGILIMWGLLLCALFLWMGTLPVPGSPELSSVPQAGVVVPLALVFAWVQAMLVIQRLRDTGLPPWPAFAGLVGLAIFLWPGALLALGVLALWPSKAEPLAPQVRVEPRFTASGV
jgi:uncharacterized membrane protein YhaH (DUF805 family)